MGDPTHEHRRAFLEEHVDVARRTLLEIGAADLPTYRREELPAVKFLDVQSRDELLEQYAKTAHRDATGVVAIDYVTEGRPIPAAVDAAFSLIVANHVIEHVPDVLGWLDELAQVATPDGLLFLAVPDRRYTFDYIRRDTDLVDLLEASFHRTRAPDFFVHLRNAYYYRPIRADDAWSDRVPELVTRQRFDIRQAITHARSGREKDADMHSHVFTCDSLTRLWGELERERLVGWKLVASRDVLPGGNEFVLLLARSDEAYDPAPVTSTTVP